MYASHHYKTTIIHSVPVADRTLQTRSPIVAAAGGGVGGAVLLAISIIGVLFFLRRR